MGNHDHEVGAFLFQARSLRGDPIPAFRQVEEGAAFDRSQPDDPDF